MLKQKASRAVGWSAADLLVRQGLQFGVSIVMARLIAPEAYGTIALLSLFTGIAMVFMDGGMSAALIQRKDSTREDESTVFWFNLAVGLTMALLLFAAADWIATFYEIDVLRPITQVYALQFFLSAFNSVQITRFTKNLDFKTPLKINTVAAVLSAIIGISLAYHGHGVWALVAQSMSVAIITTALMWSLSGWRPAFVFSRTSFRTLFGFGGFMFLSSLLNIAYQRFYTLLIGKWYGAYDLGIYNRAETTKQLPTGILSGILSRVAFPVFSQANDDPPRLKRGLRMSIKGIMLLNAPLMLGISATAEPLVLTLFGPTWVDSAPILKILALAGVLWPLHILNLSVLQAMGKSAQFFKIELIKKAVGITLILIAFPYGLQSMAWAVVAGSVIAFFINAYHNGKLIAYGGWRQIADVLPVLLCAAVMATAVTMLSTQIEMVPIFLLATLAASGALVFLALAWVSRIEELRLASAVCIKQIKKLRR